MRSNSTTAVLPSTTTIKEEKTFETPRTERKNGRRYLRGIRYRERRLTEENLLLKDIRNLRRKMHRYIKSYRREIGAKSMCKIRKEELYKRNEDFDQNIDKFTENLEMLITDKMTCTEYCSQCCEMKRKKRQVMIEDDDDL